ncbi:murein biosynthesis integral membrane protein MurJ [bacterium]|nr:murein biosynthesis integral membrane protein MurJ [bacterium]
MTNRKDRLIRSASVISIVTLFSRILGFCRDALVAHFLGISYFADAFFVAFRIPNLFRRLLGEGALSNIFITVFSDFRENKGEESAWKVASNTFKILFIILFLISLTGFVFAEPIVRMITFTFGDNSPKVLLTIDLTRIMFPYLFFIGMAAFVMGILNSFKHYFLPALSPVMLNMALISGIAGYKFFNCSGGSEQLVFILAYSVVAGGILQFFIQFPKIFHFGFRFIKNIDFNNEGVKIIFFRLIPTIFALAVTQVNIFVDTLLAWSLGQGAVSALYYSNRIMQFPLGVFGVAIATATIPEISDLIAKNKKKKFIHTLNHGLRMMFLIILPSTVGFCVLSRSIIRVIFQRGAFDSAATDATAYAFIMYSIGLVAYSGVKIITPAFYALKDTKLPTYIAIYCMILNIFLNLILMRYLSFGGLALATAISAFANFFLLVYYLGKKIEISNQAEVLKTFFKILSASGIMGLVVYGFDRYYILSNKYVHLTLAIILGCLFYFAILRVLRINEFMELIGEKKND